MSNNSTAFGIFDEKQIHENKAAILEWTVAFVFTGYILSYVMDLLPAVRSHHHTSKETVAEMGGYDGQTGYTFMDGPQQPVTRNF